jgi:heme-degrading monooxygenase HmoA
MALFLTRINVGDYDTWKPMFDEDTPGARRGAKGHRILRNVDDPAEVFILVEFASEEAARAGRERLLASGVLDRFADKTEPKIVEEADVREY